MKKKTDIYERITNRIIKEVEAGVIPWLKPWSETKAGKARASNKVDVLWPRNIISNHYYRGSNVLMCWLHLSDIGQEEAEPLFLTYKQAVAAKGHVRKGEKGCPVIGFRQGERVVEDDDGELTKKNASFVFANTVFHISQCENIVLPKHKPSEPPVGLDKDKPWKAFLDATHASIKHGGKSAFYSLMHDAIHLPTVKAFKSKQAYKAVALHELTHWTGHKSRCDRTLLNVYHSEGYAREELIAELGAAFLCARLQVPMRELRHADYIGDWLRVLKNDKRAIVQASSKAMKAATFIEELTKSVLKP